MILLANAQMTVASAPGTGNVSLGSATVGAQTWAAAGAVTGALYSYRIEEGAKWEIGHGTYNSNGVTLTRTTIIAGSNGTSAETFGTGAIVSQIALPVDIVGSNGGLGSDGTPHRVTINFDGARARLQVDATDFGRIWVAADSSLTAGMVGCEKLPSGTIEQWGSSVVTTNASGVGTISLPLTYPNAQFVPVVCNGDTGVSVAVNNPFSVLPPSNGAYPTNSIQFFVPNGANTQVRVNWRSRGN